MANMDEKMTCEVVQDLLPLYVDGACTDGSKALVEEHVKTCPGCKKLLEEMGVPLPEIPVRVPTETELVLHSVMKKLRRSRKRIVTLCLAVLLLIPTVVLGYREFACKGLRISNYRAYQRCEEMLNLWVNQGAEGCVNRMTPLYQYDQLSQVMTEYEVLSNYSIVGAGYEGEKWTMVALAGENYVFPGYCELLMERESLSGNEEIQRRALYRTGDEVGVLHTFLLGGQGKTIFVTEDTLNAIQARYGDLDMDKFRRLEWGGETYCYYDEWNLEIPPLTYPKEMTQVLGDLPPISGEYATLIAFSAEYGVMPESLWRLYQQEYRTIRECGTAYENYMEELGLGGHTEDYRNALTEQLLRLEGCGLQVTGGEILSCYRIDSTNGEQFVCLLKMGDETAIAGFQVQENPGVGLTCWLNQFDCDADDETVQQTVAEIKSIIKVGG